MRTAISPKLSHPFVVYSQGTKSLWVNRGGGSGAPMRLVEDNLRANTNVGHTIGEGKTSSFGPFLVKLRRTSLLGCDKLATNMQKNQHRR